MAWARERATSRSGARYGLVAGMTEGGSFLSRPNEHWFLIWIPLALVAAFTVRSESPPSQRDGRENR